ncbi:hypothetical protein, partial [Stenotrophomonas maltophilia]|uniref:hypothetical protein n=1 Tax=Stenotrophomonas maltophilia TaxID=40324 RepID=UPI003144DC46
SRARPRRPAPASPTALDSLTVTGGRVAAPAAATDGQLGIQLAAWQPDSAIARRMRQGPQSQLYDRYLAELDAHADCSAFF